MDEPSAPVQMRVRGRWSMRRPRTHTTHDVDRHGLVSPLRDPALTLRRSLLVNGLFKYVEEIRNLEAGYAFRFRRSHDQNDCEKLIGAIADYIIFESRHAPQLTFEDVEEPQDKAFWLHVRGIRSDQDEGTSTSILPDSALPYLA